MTAETIAPPVSSKELENLAVLRYAFEQNGDETNTRKMTELIRKVKDSEIVLGFCGHFSAGKSTMINHIAGVDLLPSNPIPTTANLAKIRTGDSAYARVYFQDEEPVEYPYPYDLDEIRNYAIDGKVRSIEISHPLKHFEPGTTLLDTPGIDSTDEAHRISTESALHLADVLFYVTDYNHVLSEMNLAFLKKLQQQGKRIVLVVNQIDKHSNAELDFHDYRQGISDAFSAQDIELEAIFYTSLKADEHPHNEFPELQKFIRSLFEDKDLLLVKNTETAAHQLIADHIDRQAASHDDKREQLEKSLNGLSEDERQSLLADYHTLEQQLQELEAKPGQFFDHAQAELTKILDSAILMPYETREAGRSYLESIQPGFKIGLFGSKKKTGQEQKDRLQQFFKKVSETASALDWQVKEGLIKEMESFAIQDETLKQGIYDLQVSFSQQLLVDQIQSGATFNANYVLRYTNKVSEAIQHCYRRAAVQKMEEALAILNQEVQSEAADKKARLAVMDEKLTAIKQLQQLDGTVRNERERLDEILSGQFDEPELEAALSALPELEDRPVQKTKAPRSKKVPEKQIAPVQAEQVEEPEADATVDFQQRLQKTAQQLKRVSNEITSIKGLQASAREMQERAERLENNRFTVALFGAFSAGKSSFANALIGESALPVSPNPTTAAINKISPPDEEHQHKTARVQWKQEKDMLADVLEALKPYGKTIQELDELNGVLSDLEAEERHASFLQSVAQGADAFKEKFGSGQNVDFDTFYNIVSNEANAVFVESVELYYDCPLTRQGITLVDTPGADSINARHTGVAFDYIKNADAILFVTYYNHAFSRADREFLIQLGRVKDSFAMDKMFFIVNAADLAASEHELNTVVNYVGENLVSYGIRQPRIYPISSQKALAGKQTDQGTEADALQKCSGMVKFEKDFTHFTMDKLTNIAVDAARADVNRTIHTLDSYIASAREDKNVRLQQRDAALQKKNEIEALIRHSEGASEKQALEQEIDQLVYYTEQRVFLRYLDFFKETFNPSILGKSGIDKKKTLRACLNELLEQVGYDLSQEMRATALRVEKFLGTSLGEIFSKTEDKIQNITEDYAFSAYEPQSFETPAFEKAFEGLNTTDFDEVLKLFKNPKQFFEQNGRMKMREELQSQLRQPVADYLEASREQLKHSYTATFEQEVTNLQEQLLDQVREYTEGKLAALSMDVDAEQLEQTRKEIEKMMD